MRRFAESLGYAVEGIHHAGATQRNIRIQCGLLVGSLLVAIGCGLPGWSLLALGAVWTLVLIVELLNTALEELSEGLWGLLYHPRAKLVKDLAAGAVLLSAATAAVVTAGLFWLYRDRLLAIRPLLGWTLFGAVVFYAVVIRARSVRPALAVGLASIVAALQRWVRG